MSEIPSPCGYGSRRARVIGVSGIVCSFKSLAWLAWEAEQDMRFDAVSPAVIDGADINGVFQVPVDAFNLEQLPVAHGDVLGTQFLVAGAHQVLPVKLRFSSNLGLVDDQVAVLQFPEVLVKGSLIVDVLGNFVLYAFGNLFHGHLLLGEVW